MKKWFLLVLLLPFVGVNAFEVLTEANVAYLQPIGDRFQKIYGGGPIYGAELTFPVNVLCHKFGPWIGVSFFTKNGKSFGNSCNSGQHFPTEVQFVPVDFGIKVFAPCKKGVDFYFVMGGRYAFLTTHDQDQFGKISIHKKGLGVIVKGGGLFDFSKKTFLDVFVNYSYNTFSGTHSPCLVPARADVATVSAGIGIGYRFECL